MAVGNDKFNIQFPLRQELSTLTLSRRLWSHVFQDHLEKLRNFCTNFHLSRQENSNSQVKIVLPRQKELWSAEMINNIQNGMFPILALSYTLFEPNMVPKTSIFITIFTGFQQQGIQTSVQIWVLISLLTSGQCKGNDF